MGNPLCPRCQKELAFVMHPPPEETRGDGNRVSLPLDSSIFRCADHGNWRIYVSGAAKPYPG